MRLSRKKITAPQNKKVFYLIIFIYKLRNAGKNIKIGARTGLFFLTINLIEYNS